MKTLFAIAILSLFTGISKAQTISIEEPLPEKKFSKKELDTLIFTSVSQLPEFPGGSSKLFSYIKDNLQIPTNPDPSVSPRVIVTFIVDRNGKLSDVKVTGQPKKDYDAEAIRVMKASPKWIPGKNGAGQIVRVKYSVPVSFR